MVSTADVSGEVLEKEKAIEMEKEDIKSKPEAMRYVYCCAAPLLGHVVNVSLCLLSSQGQLPPAGAAWAGARLSRGGQAGRRAALSALSALSARHVPPRP